MIQNIYTKHSGSQMKCTVQSKKGSALVIPQTDKIVRIYIQIVSFDGEEWDSAKTMKASDVQQLANEIFAPYFLEWEHVDWFSIYPIGQGISQRYTLDERVFMGGDACHTHSVSLSFTSTLHHWHADSE